MQLTVVDGNNQEQVILVASATETIVDGSGSITTANASLPLLAANADRAGYLLQNQSADAMTIADLGGDATQPGAWIVPPGAFFPPPGLALSTAAINIAGPTVGAKYALRSW